MKKLILMVLAIGTLASCGHPAKNSSSGTKALVVYFSRSGNTETIARYISEVTDAGMLRIEPVDPYSTVDSICGARVDMEIANNLHPKIATKIENLSSYDVIFIGSPLWQATIAPPVKTLLSSYDFSGKILVPFTTYGSQGMGHSMSDIKKLCPHSTVVEGRAFKGSEVKEAKSEVVRWLHEIKMLK